MLNCGGAHQIVAYFDAQIETSASIWRFFLVRKSSRLHLIECSSISVLALLVI